MAKRNLFGLIYDTETRKLSYEDSTEPLPIGNDWQFEDHGEGYNPLQYATDFTGEKVIAFMRIHFGPGLNFRLYRPEYAFYPLPKPLHVEVESNGIKESFNVGLIANSLIRSGSFASLRSSMKTAGLLF